MGSDSRGVGRGLARCGGQSVLPKEIQGAAALYAISHRLFHWNEDVELCGHTSMANVQPRHLRTRFWYYFFKKAWRNRILGCSQAERHGSFHGLNKSGKRLLYSIRGPASLLGNICLFDDSGHLGNGRDDRLATKHRVPYALP